MEDRFKEVSDYKVWLNADPSHNRRQSVLNIATEHGWCLRKEGKNPPVLIFDKGDCQVNVFYNPMTVATVVTHPVQGRTQLFRRNVDKKLLKQIFENPRVHTCKGYKRVDNRKI